MNKYIAVATDWCYGKERRTLVGENGQEIIVEATFADHSIDALRYAMRMREHMAEVAREWEVGEVMTATNMNTCIDDCNYKEDWFCQYCAQENDAENHHCHYCGGNKPQ